MNLLMHRVLAISITLLVVSSLVHRNTHTAAPHSVWIHDKAIIQKRMTMNAAIFLLGGAADRWVKLSSAILRSGDGLQMGRVDTILNSARVINRESIWDGSYQELIRKAVGEFPKSHSAISPFVERPQPNPAVSGLVYAIPKVLVDRRLSYHQDQCKERISDLTVLEVPLMRG